MKTAVKRIAFFGRSKEQKPAHELLAVAGRLAASGVEVWFEANLAQHCSSREITAAGVTVLPMEEIRQADVGFVLGGDGTFLGTARHCAPLGIPLAGINLGYLGFLTDVSREDMEGAINEICCGKYQLEKRFTLSARVERKGRDVAESSAALAINDIVVSRGEAGLLLGMRVFINQTFVYNLRADGLIVATPSGSTAYALAAGGPIVTPNLRAMLLVPLCAHALTHRPLAISSVRTEVAIEITKSRHTRLHLDGQFDLPLATGDVVRVTRHAKPLKICHPLSYDYYKTLRQKLSWGG